MGGVDLLNQSNKAYRISIRRKKWYWGLYTWFLNVQMVQAWHLYRATMRVRHQKQQNTVESEVEFAEDEGQACR